MRAREEEGVADAVIGMDGWWQSRHGARVEKVT